VRGPPFLSTFQSAPPRFINKRLIQILRNDDRRPWPKTTGVVEPGHQGPADCGLVQSAPSLLTFYKQSN
jgi:hypothetical protein